MNEISYRTILSKSCVRLFEYISKCFLSIILLAFAHLILKYTMYHALKTFIDGLWFIIIFDTVFKPLILISLFIILEDSESILQSSFYGKLKDKISSKYIKILTLCLVVRFFSIYLGSASIILYSVIFLKIPFIEVMIFKTKASLLESVRRNNYITKDKLLRYLLILLFVFLSVRALAVRSIASVSISVSWEVVSLSVEYLRNILILIYFTYIFSLYNVLKIEKLYLK